MQPRVITFFEHQARSYPEIGLPPDHPVFEQLEQANRQAKREILGLGRKTVKANEMVGLVRAGEFTFQILPKVGRESGGSGDSGEVAGDAARNLLFLLDYAYDLRLYLPSLALSAHLRAGWYEFLIHLFAADLHRQLRLGFAQAFVPSEERLSVMRGRWDLNRQIGRHAFIKDRFDVRFDEFSPDIYLNQVLRYAVEMLRQSTTDARSRELLAGLSSWLEPVTLLNEAPAAGLDQVQFNRLTERFRPAFQLARLFLAQQAVRLQGGSADSFAFVFDMNVLFERFAARFLARHRRAILPASWQDMQIAAQAASRLHLAWRIAQGRQVPVARLKPDILFQRPGSLHPSLIVDTKYKQLDARARRLGVAESDLYQMLAYSTRFECPETVLLYPQPEAGTAVHEAFALEPGPGRVWIHTIDLHQPLQRPEQLFGDFQRIFEPFTGG